MLEKRIGSGFVYICDECAEELETEEPDFHSALVVMKEAGWHARKIDDKWMHYCLECKTMRVK